MKVALFIIAIAMISVAMGGMNGLHVSGTNILNTAGTAVQLLGVTKAGTEYMCLTYAQAFDGPYDNTSVVAMQAWGINTVRIPLNEYCWNGGSNAVFGGSQYQTAIKNYVLLLKSYGFAVILSLARSAPGTTVPTSASPMPDSDHSTTFWTSVAGVFAGTSQGYSNVLFELFAQPYPGNGGTSTSQWTCWKNGGSDPGCSETYTTVGMNSLVTSIRGVTGATNVIIVSGIQYGNSVSKWTTYRPSDTNIVAGVRIYDTDPCNSISCWTNNIHNISISTPVVITEASQSTCTSSFLQGVLSWADSYNLHYSATQWNTVACSSSNYGLLVDYSGTPTGLGTIYKNHIQSK